MPTKPMYNRVLTNRSMPCRWSGKTTNMAELRRCSVLQAVCTKMLTELTRCGYSHPKRQEREVVALFEQGWFSSLRFRDPRWVGEFVHADLSWPIFVRYFAK